MILERRKLAVVRLDVEPDRSPAQAVLLGPFFEGGELGGCLGRIIGIEIGPVFRLQRQPCDHRNLLLIEHAHDLRAFRREIGEGDSHLRMQIAESCNRRGIGKERLHLRDALIATGKAELRSNAGPLNGDCGGRACEGRQWGDSRDAEANQERQKGDCAMR